MRGRASSLPISWELRFSAETVLRASTPPATALMESRPDRDLKGSAGMPSILSERAPWIGVEQARLLAVPLRACMPR